MKKAFFLLFLLFASLFSKEYTKSFSLVKGEALVFEFKDLKKLTLNEKVSNFFQNPTKKGYYLAIVAMPYKNYKLLKLRAFEKDSTFFYKIKPLQGGYKKEKIKVSKKKTTFSKKTLARVKKELVEVRKLYNFPLKKTLFKKPFLLPLNSRETSPFGTARVFNKSLRSFHSGVDLRAKYGTKVKASNDGLVRLVARRFFAGNTVIIDHGAGIFTQYYHLSKFLVKKGDFVKRGEVIALSGASGRVSGPHLHFGVRVQNTQVNPKKFIKEINKFL